MLPKIDSPTYNLTIPSLKKSLKFRPFLVKEEKLLLMAKETNNPIDYLSAMKQVITNCCYDKKFNIDNLTVFDIEFLFIRIRAFSVDNIVTLKYIDNEDDQEYTFKVDLNKIEVQFPDKIDNVIKINDSIGIVMKYPSALLYDDKEFLESSDEHLFQLVIKCMHQIYENDTVYECAKYKTEEIEAFLDSLEIKTYEKMLEFLTNVPKLYYKIEYKNSKGNSRKIELTKLEDFFP